MRKVHSTTAVWDPLIRLCHWCLALCFAVAYYLGSDWLGLHAQLGYTIALLVLFRIVWGFIGPNHALFSDFVPSPSALRIYLAGIRDRSVVNGLGHDPLGALMILALLISLLVTTYSGMTLWAMEGRGPLVGTFVVELPGAVIEDVHHFASDLVLVLVVVHVLGVLVMGRLHQQRLIRAMFDGEKWS